MRAVMTEGVSHELRGHFAQYHSTAALQQDAQYQQHQAMLAHVLTQYEHAVGDAAMPAQSYYRVTAWNIERGMHLDAIIAALQASEELRCSDVLLVTETDLGMARSGNRNVARELAMALGYHYFFVPSYLNLAKGSGVEAQAEGENAEGLHGNAILSRYPLSNLAHVALPNGKDKMRGNEKRLGCQNALVATVQFPQGAARVVCAHLDAHARRKHRALQMRCILDHLQAEGGDLPTLIGGDWNTCTYNSHCARAGLLDIIKRLHLGSRRVITKHYPHPDRWFERDLFRTLERYGYDYRGLNEAGVGTLYYDFYDAKQRVNLEEMLPPWMFHILRWVTRSVNGRCALKLDWFAGRGVKRADLQQVSPRPDLGPAQPPRVLVGKMEYQGRLITDHDPIVLDLCI